MTLVVKPPDPLHRAAGTFAVFLAGSIEMGAAAPWQDEIAAALAGAPVTLWNPRREAWDPTWRQSIDEPRFHEQVTWELDAQEQADLIVMYFAPGTRSPITLLELGLFARSGKLVVCCPEGFWRRGNVEVVCQRYGVPRVDHLAELVVAIRRGLAQA
jgi:hypothetical protein